MLLFRRRSKPEGLGTDSKGGPAVSPLMVRCNGCVRVPCVLSCDSNAIAQVCGDLLIELDKCAVCKRYKVRRSRGTGIPNCVAVCKHSQAKLVLEVPDEQTKQTRAATALSLLKL